MIDRKWTSRPILFFFALGLLAACTGAPANSGSTQDYSDSPAPVATQAAAVANTAKQSSTRQSALQPETAAPAAVDTPVDAEDNAVTERTLLAGTNVARHSVPLEAVHFDTFDGSYVALADITEALILQLRDAIPPIETPKYTDVETAGAWLQPADTVVGYVDGEKALAYPTKILNYHEIVNETVNGLPILVSYCPLCDSGIVYDRRLEGQVLEFGNTSALHQSDMVMYDKQTLSYWFQVGGDAIVGDLTGKRLAVLPTRFMRWTEWRDAYPNSQVLSRDTGFNRPYDRDPFTGLPEYLNRGRFPFPVGEAARNPTLPAGERVISLVIDEVARAYPITALQGQVVNDELGKTPIAVVIDEAGTALAFDRRIDNQRLTLKWIEGKLKDEETGSTWALVGTATEGPLTGTQLVELPARFSFWFAFVAAFPGGSAYQP